MSYPFGPGGEGYDEYGYYYPQQQPQRRRTSGGPHAFLATTVVVTLFGTFAYLHITPPGVSNLLELLPTPAAQTSAAAPPNAVLHAPAPNLDPIQVGGSEADQVAAQLWHFLRNNGLTREQAAGVMGNAQAESGFNPDVVERANGIGFGLFQWSFARRNALEATARDQQVAAGNLTFQMAYFYAEMHARKPIIWPYEHFPSDWAALVAQHTVADALVAFHHTFEASNLLNAANPYQAVVNARLGFALRFYNNPAQFP